MLWTTAALAVIASGLAAGEGGMETAGLVGGERDMCERPVDRYLGGSGGPGVVANAAFAACGGASARPLHRTMPSLQAGYRNKLLLPLVQDSESCVWLKRARK